MNLLLLDEKDRLEGDRFFVDGRRAHHMVQVLKVAVGQVVRVGLLNGPVGTAMITEARGDGFEIIATFERTISDRPLDNLCLAVPRPKTLRRLLPDLAAIGLDHLVLMRTWRTEKPYLSSDILTPEVYRPFLHDGLMQSRTTHEPSVSIERAFRPFVEDRLPSIGAGTRCLVAHPDAARPLSEVHLSPEERVTLVVGPEGGLVPYELDKLSEAGFEAVRLGPRILRVEAACIALLASIDLLRRSSPPSASLCAPVQ